MIVSIIINVKGDLSWCSHYHKIEFYVSNKDTNNHRSKQTNNEPSLGEDIGFHLNDLKVWRGSNRENAAGLSTTVNVNYSCVGCFTEWFVRVDDKRGWVCILVGDGVVDEQVAWRAWGREFSGPRATRSSSKLALMDTDSSGHSPQNKCTLLHEKPTH